MEAKIERIQLLATRLYDAAVEGDLPSLLNLLKEDPFILDRCTILIDHKTGQVFNQSPLHVAANLGHLKIVKALLKVNPEMCLVTDHQGRNPVHVAAIRGQVLVIEELVRAMPQAARERTACGETVLHLCIKYSQLEALKVLVNVMEFDELINSKDSDGNTILHVAVAAKQAETVKFLLKIKSLDKNVSNTSGFTAMDLFIRRKKHDPSDQMEIIGNSLKQAKALRAKRFLLKRPRIDPRSTLENQRNALMVVASLIATMAFQVAVSPPGGTYQDSEDGAIPGTPIMLVKSKYLYWSYEKLLIFNTIAFISSLSVIFLLISGLPCKRLFVVILMITMWIAVSATTLTYICSVNFLTLTIDDRDGKWSIICVTIMLVWLILMLILLLLHVTRFIVKLIKRRFELGKRSLTKALSKVTGRLC